MADLKDLAAKIEGLGAVCAETVASATPEIRAAIMKMGRKDGGGPLRAGNYAVAEVEPSDTSTIHMRMVNSSDRSFRSWMKWVEKTLREHMQRAFEKRIG